MRRTVTVAGAWLSAAALVGGVPAALAQGGGGGDAEAGAGTAHRSGRAAEAEVAAAGAAGGPARAVEADTAMRTRPVSLQEAVETALRENPDHRQARLEAARARQGARAARDVFFPRLQATTGYMRSVDPVAAFGTKLRQGRFSQQDLAFDVLNDPDPVEDWTVGAGFRWTLVDPTGWASASAAGHRADAADWARSRSRDATVFRTRTLYYRAAWAEGRVAAAESALQAARETREVFRERREEGLLTEAELLQAEAEVEAARARRVEARRVRDDARQKLGLFLGWSPDSVPVPADSLGAPEPVGEQGFRPAARPDLRALDARRKAAEAEVERATSSFLPSVEAFGEYAVHARDPLESDGSDWTAGIRLRLPLFAGFERFARREAARAAAREAEIEYEHALREATVEVSRARRAVRSARQRAEATRAAARAAEKGRDLMRRRFEQGLAIASDVLQAEARAAELRSRAVNALAAYHSAVARLEFVRAQPEAGR